MKSLLEISKISAQIDSKEVLKDLSFSINKGEIHVIMGPNGAGKSTLASALMGHPKIEISNGSITFDGVDILELSPEKRAAVGLFLAFQYPREIAGVQLDRFLFTALNTLRKSRGEDALPIIEFKKKLQEEMKALKLDESFATRSLNKGFSGGEKKKAEMLQLGILSPTLAILDETDSGLDVDALKIVGEAITRFSNDDNAVLLVTHYQRLLEYVKPDHIHIMVDGKIVKSGGPELAQEIEKEGFEQYTK